MLGAVRPPFTEVTWRYDLISFVEFLTLELYRTTFGVRKSLVTLCDTSNPQTKQQTTWYWVITRAVKRILWSMLRMPLHSAISTSYENRVVQRKHRRWSIRPGCYVVLRWIFVNQKPTVGDNKTVRHYQLNFSQWRLIAKTPLVTCSEFPCLCYWDFAMNETTRFNNKGATNSTFYSTRGAT